VREGGGGRRERGREGGREGERERERERGREREHTHTHWVYYMRFLLARHYFRDSSD
jgi:hypothetical protein